MVKRLALGIAGIALILAAFWAARADAADFKRPDCSAFQGSPHPESRCFRKHKQDVRDANYEALQKTGLEFAYLARPVAGDELEKAYPDAAKAAKDEVEGEFLITFSIGTDGKVTDVTVVESSSQRIGYLAKLWADTIAQWQFTKTSKPVTGVPFRRVYLYSKEDDDSRSDRNSD